MEYITNKEDKINLIIKALERSAYDPFGNLTVEDVSKDLLLGKNKANELFKRKDFPSVNIGKTKTVTVLAYLIWKMSRKEEL